MIRLDSPVCFLSDAHLGAAAPEEEAAKLLKLHSFLEGIEARARSLVLVGDIFDFWFEWASVIPKEHFHLLCRFRELIRGGFAVHYLPGNHDFRLKGFLESDVGMVIYKDDAEFQIGEQKIYVYHGDGILARDSGYRFLKRVLHSRINQRLFSWLHPDIGMALARATSKESRTNERYLKDDEDEYEAFARGRFARGFQAVVLGHSHHPRFIELPEGIYVNLGDWIEYFSYAVHDGERLTLHYWQDSESIQKASN